MWLPLTSSQVVQDVVQVFADDEHSFVGGLEGLFGELSHVRLQEGVEDVREGFPSLLLQVLLRRQTLLRLPLHHLSHLTEGNTNCSRLFDRTGKLLPCKTTTVNICLIKHLSIMFQHLLMNLNQIFAL